MIKEAKKLAYYTLKNEIRRALAKYYLLWSTFPALYSPIYYIIDSLSLKSFLLYSISFLIPIFIYISLTFVFFNKVAKVWGKFYKIYPEINREQKGKFFILYSLIGILLLILLIIYSYYDLNSVFEEILEVFYVGLVLVGLYYSYRMVGLRYYDVVALVSFTVLMTLSNLNNIISVFTYSFFTISWIYAGYKSINEVAENE
ncbi:hypothetical protein SUSAZ_04960 [Sulfolobus acidocaldarius SUSAZ]|nr:hypothetical protein SUSAZ_04960 [Sulfolobus acidocaldarius SUSAZ]